MTHHLDLGLNRFDAITLLETLRNKRLVFVGDSLNRNQWVSLVCMVEASIPDVRHKMQITNGSLLSFGIGMFSLINLQVTETNNFD